VITIYNQILVHARLTSSGKTCTIRSSNETKRTMRPQSGIHWMNTSTPRLDPVVRDSGSSARADSPHGQPRERCFRWRARTRAILPNSRKACGNSRSDHRESRREDHPDHLQAMPGPRVRQSGRRASQGRERLHHHSEDLGDGKFASASNCAVNGNHGGIERSHGLQSNSFTHSETQAKYVPAFNGKAEEP